MDVFDKSADKFLTRDAIADAKDASCESGVVTTQVLGRGRSYLMPWFECRNMNGVYGPVWTSRSCPLKMGEIVRAL